MQSANQQNPRGGAGAPKSPSSPAGKRRGWWRRNWWKAALTAVLVPLLGGAGFVAWKFGPVMFSKPYRMAYHELGQSRPVIDQLGEPISGNWIPGGSVDSDSAHLFFEIWGPKTGKSAKAQVAVQAHYMEGQWGFTQFEVTLADGHRLNLLEEIAVRLNDDRPKFDASVPHPSGVTIQKAPPDLDINIPDVPDGK